MSGTFGNSGHGYFSTSSVEIALGSLCSPSRRVKDCEYAAERALSSGSSEGEIPSGSTSGSKLISRVGLVSSLSMVSIVNVPASICCLSGGQARRRVRGRIARLAYGEHQMPVQRLGMKLRDQCIEQVVLAGCRRAVWLGRLIRLHRPSNRSGLAFGIDETEGVQGVVRAVRRIRTRTDACRSLAAPRRFPDASPERRS